MTAWTTNKRRGAVDGRLMAAVVNNSWRLEFRQLDTAVKVVLHVEGVRVKVVVV